MSAPATSSVLIETRALSKSYPKVFRRRDRLRALARLLTGRGNLAAEPVLKDIDLNVARGQSLGLIGENGAGKSTLLKLLTGVLTPSSGTVRVHGRIGALLELGAGFHPEYSGRDNIALAGTLYGLSVEELRAKLPEIIGFADIGHYIDEPVKHYSSGMVVRLGFAVVAATCPDLLITDEVLAVGDESFQKKCVRWIETYLEGGGTLILVSHSMYHVQKLCQQACWLREGKMAAYGDVYDVTQAYLAFHERKSAEKTTQSRVEIEAKGLEFHVRDMTLNGSDAKQMLVLDQGADLLVEARIASRDGRVPVVHVGIVRADGTPVYGVSSDMDAVQPLAAQPGEYQIGLRFPQLSLLPGGYTVRVHPLDSEGVRLFDTYEGALTIRGKSRELGLVRLQHVWEPSMPIVAAQRGVAV